MAHLDPQDNERIIILVTNRWYKSFDTWWLRAEYINGDEKAIFLVDISHQTFEHARHYMFSHIRSMIAADELAVIVGSPGRWNGEANRVLQWVDPKQKELVLVPIVILEYI